MAYDAICWNMKKFSTHSVFGQVSRCFNPMKKIKQPNEPGRMNGTPLPCHRLPYLWRQRHQLIPVARSHGCWLRRTSENTVHPFIVNRRFAETILNSTLIAYSIAQTMQTISNNKDFTLISQLIIPIYPHIYIYIIDGCNSQSIITSPHTHTYNSHIMQYIYIYMYV